jgi:hypothetical protein
VQSIIPARKSTARSARWRWAVVSASSDDPARVLAPNDAVGWTADLGFVDDPRELDAASRRGDAIFHVSEGAVYVPDGVASLAGLARADRDVAVLAAEMAGLHVRLLDVAERLVERLAARD